MKMSHLRRIVTLTAFCFALLNARADITTGLIAYYPFEGNANDATGNGWNGNPIGGPTLTAGVYGQAYFFDGVNDRISLPGSFLNSGLPQGTVSCWIRVDSFNATYGRCIFNRGVAASSTALQFNVDGSPGKLRGHINNNSLSPGNAILPLNQFIHVGLTWNGAKVRYYLNGSLDREISFTPTVPSGSSRTVDIGVDDQNVGWFHGIIDDVRFYNRALSASDIQQLYGLNSIPLITQQPQGTFGITGVPAMFNVTAQGPGPLYYQWWKDGNMLAGKTASTLSIFPVTAADAGYYSVVVSNSFGNVTSKTVRLAIPGDPTAGVTPPQVDCGPVPIASPGKDSLVFITHGWRKITDSGDFAWVNDMATVISNRLFDTGQSNWDVVSYNWSAGLYSSLTLLPDTALMNGYTRGHCLGESIRTQAWTHVHLIGHSAGSAVIQGIADALDGSGKTVHTTFLDPFLSLFTATFYGRTHYGTHADWSDNYFAHDITTKFTEGKVNNTHNVEVTWLDPQKNTVPRLCAIPFSNPSETSMHQCGYLSASSRHEWPHEFYLKSVSNGFASYPDYGFVRSKEGGGWDNRSSYQTGNPPVNLGDLSETFAAPDLTLIATPLQLTDLPKATSGSVSVSSSTLTLVTASPAWISLGLTITNQVNAVVFDAAFTNGGGSEGLLSVYWDTNEVGIVDERVAGTSWQTYTMPLPFVEVGGVHLLGLRLDPYSTTNSSLVITNVQTAWITTQDPTVSMSVDTNTQLPMLTLNGFPGAPYLVESSTNLLNWTNVGVFSSTNTIMHYVDPGSSTNQQQFYRARAW